MNCIRKYYRNYYGGCYSHNHESLCRYGNIWRIKEEDINLHITFILACQYGHFNMAVLALKKRIKGTAPYGFYTDNNCATIYGIVTYIHKGISLAAKNNNAKIIEFILNNYRVKNANALALKYACLGGHLELVDLLMDKYDAKFSIPALQNACMNGDYEIIKRLNVADSESIYRKALIYSCEYGVIELVKILLEKWAYDKEQINYGLMVASVCGHTNVMHLLVEQYGANNIAECIEECNLRFCVFRDAIMYLRSL